MPSVDIRNKAASRDRKLVVLSPVNARGHINMLLEYADILKEHHNYRTLFLITGPTQATNIEPRGHELLVLRDNQDPRQGLFAETRDEKYTTYSPYNQIIVDTDLPAMKEHGEEQARYLMFAKVGVPSISKHHWLRYHDNFERALNLLRPDLVMFDQIHLPPCVHTLQMPWVVTHSINPFMLALPKVPNPPMPWTGNRILTKEERERLRRDEPQKWQAMLDKWASIQDITFPVNNVPAWTELCKRYNHNETQPYRVYSPYLNLYVYPSECDYDQDDDLFYYTPKWFRCDTIYPMDTKPTQTDLLWAAKLELAMRDRPQVVYFSLGTIASSYSDYINRYVEIFARDTKRLYVISKGAVGEKVKLNAPNVIGDDYLPQRLILKYASVAIIHGGNNSFLECVYYGVPMIVLACFGDQFDNAARVEDLNIGRRLDLFKPDADKILGAVDELCDDLVVRKKLNLISQRVQSRDSRQKVSYLLNKLTEDKAIDNATIEECRQMETPVPEPIRA